MAKKAKLRHGRAHDYKYLIDLWRAVVKKTGLRMTKFSEAGGYPIYCVRSAVQVTAQPVPSIYLSAGIHGDEPASTEGLLAWAQKNTALLGKLNVLIFPCLNPWGLTGNCRLNADGRDLNRAFHDDAIPQIAAQKRIMGKRRFDLALNLHEDYDAMGLYAYEVPGQKTHWGEKILRAASRHLPIDTRRNIEGRAASGGVVRRAIKLDVMPDWPEAFVLHLAHSHRVFTFETPSEFHIDDRVDAQVAIITEAVKLAAKEFSLRLGRGAA